MILPLEMVNATTHRSVDVRQVAIDHIQRRLGMACSCIDRSPVIGATIDEFMLLPQAGEHLRLAIKDAPCIVVQSMQLNDDTEHMSVTIGYPFDSDVGRTVAMELREILKSTNSTDVHAK